MNSEIKKLISILTDQNTLKGERLVLALHSIAWAIYMLSPLVYFTFVNIAGAIMLLIYATGILLEVFHSKTIRVSEGLNGIALWVIVIVYHLQHTGFDGTIFLMTIPLSLAWWIFCMALATRRKFNVVE